MYLRYVTITGIDQQADFSRIRDLSWRFPFVEWGFLYSPSRQGKETRYMSVEAINRFAAYCGAGNLSLHLCGKGVQDLLWKSHGINLHYFDRIQLNANEYKDYQIKTICDSFRDKQIICQLKDSTRSSWHDLYTIPNLAWLGDDSGGRGKETVWLSPIPGIFCGYAGGISPYNIQTKLNTLKYLIPSGVTWIDMESGVRTNDWLDLDKVENILKVCANEN